MDWSDIPYVIRPDSGGYHLIHYRNPYTEITNPIDTAENRRLGAGIFASRCARCHGEAAQRRGPALVGRSLTHGDSDWSVFRTIRRGVPRNRNAGLGSVAR